MIPSGSILGEGDLQVFALQASLAVNERLSIVATKDGYNTLQADGIPNDQGFSDIAAGLKYVFVRDTCQQFFLSGGIIYEWSQGTSGVFQGNGDGVWHIFLTTGKEFGCNHFVGAFGWHLPNNISDESESIYYSLHLDREVACGWYALWELNGIHYVESGRALPVSQEGGDWINLGATDVAGNHFLSTAVGATKKVNRHLSLSAAFEFPITGCEDLFNNRTYVQKSLTY